LGWVGGVLLPPGLSMAMAPPSLSCTLVSRIQKAKGGYRTLPLRLVCASTHIRCELLCHVMVQLKKLIQGTITARAGCTRVKEPCKLGQLQQHVATGENVCTFQQSTAKHKLECREALCRVGVLTSYKPFLSWKVTSVGAVSRGCTCPPPLLLVTTHRLPKPHLSPHIHAYADTQSVLSMHLLGDWYLARHVSESNAYAEMQALNA